MIYIDIHFFFFVSTYSSFRYHEHFLDRNLSSMCMRTDQLIPFADGKYIQDSAYGVHHGIFFISWHRSSIYWEVENTGCMQCPIYIGVDL